MATNKRDLKSYARYDGNGRIIPGGNILARNKPKVGQWIEGPAYYCCNGTQNVTRLSGVWYLLDTYTPPMNNGEICFPDHANGVAVLDPNLVGQLLPTSAVMLYINSHNFAGVDHDSELGAMAGRSGKLILTQGSDSVTYSFTADAIINGFMGFNVFYDSLFGASVPGSLTVDVPSAANFDASTPITISIILT